MYASHPDVSLPLPATAPLWRYMPVNRFAALISDRALWFARADQFDDRWEGAGTRAEIARRRERLTSAGYTAAAQEVFARSNEQFRFRAYVSCWCTAEYEAEALWGRYGGDADKVAVRTTVGRLQAALAGDERPIHIGKVTYLDYETQEFDTRSGWSALLHKRRQYSSDAEVRALFFSSGRVIDIAANAQVRLDLTRVPTGLPVRVDVATLVEQVRVPPLASEEKLHHVQQLAHKHGLNPDVCCHSDLSVPPEY